MKTYLQNVAYNAYAPHIRVESYPIKVDDLRRYKFRSSEQHLQRFAGIVTTCHAKVNYLDAISSLCEAQHILRLQIQMNDVFTVNELDAFAYLPHEYCTCFFSEYIVLLYYALKQLTALNSISRGNILKITFNYGRIYLGFDKLYSWFRFIGIKGLTVSKSKIHLI